MSFSNIFMAVRALCRSYVHRAHQALACLAGSYQSRCSQSFSKKGFFGVISLYNLLIPISTGARQTQSAETYYTPSSISLPDMPSSISFIDPAISSISNFILVTIFIILAFFIVFFCHNYFICQKIHKKIPALSIKELWWPIFFTAYWISWPMLLFFGYIAVRGGLSFHYLKKNWASRGITFEQIDNAAWCAYWYGFFMSILFSIGIVCLFFVLALFFTVFTDNKWFLESAKYGFQSYTSFRKIF